MNTTEDVSISVRDAEGNPVAASNLKLTVFTADSQVFIPSYVAAGRITNPSLGQYVFTLGGDPLMAETNTAQTLMFLWQADNQPSTTQQVNVVTIMTMSLLGRFQDQIDKSHKDVEEDPDNPVYLGYTTWQLLMYLYGGLGIIDSFQPSPTWPSLDAFPVVPYGQVLIDAGMLVGIHSQELYAVDTDIDQWSNQGNTFVISHFAKLEAFANTLWAQLQVLVPQLKLQFVNSGSLHIELGANYRLAQLLTASPSGGLFRGTFVAGL